MVRPPEVGGHPLVVAQRLVRPTQYQKRDTEVTGDISVGGIQHERVDIEETCIVVHVPGEGIRAWDIDGHPQAGRQTRDIRLFRHVQTQRQPLLNEILVQPQPVGAAGSGRPIDRPLPRVLDDQPEHQPVFSVERRVRREPVADASLIKAQTVAQQLRRHLVVDLVVAQRMQRSRRRLGGVGGIPRSLIGIELSHRIITQLFDVPPRIAQRQIDHRHILPDFLDLLGVPQGEGIVVAVGEDYAVRFDRLQQVAGEVQRQTGLRTVSTAGRREIQHKGKQGDSEDRGRDLQRTGNRRAALPIGSLEFLPREPIQAGDANAGEQPPHLKRDQEEIIPLPDLVHAEVGVLIESQGKARLEIHVTHERRAGDQENQ